SSDLHGQQVAIQHGGRLLERLGQAHRRHFHRKAARLPDTALDLFHTLLEMAMAGVDVAPGVDDGDDRLAGIVGAVIPHLRGARPVAERTQVFDPIPAMAAQIFGAFALRVVSHVGAESFDRSYGWAAGAGSCLARQAPRRYGTLLRWQIARRR